MNVQERFESKYIPEPNSGCWIWMAALSTKGYGKFSLTRCTWTGAHRVSYSIYKGDPGKHWVLHRCDNPPCVNPDHLFLGNAQTNVEDKCNKFRQERRANHHSAKLNELDVKRIRESNEMGTILAIKYNISAAAISLIRNWRTWL